MYSREALKKLVGNSYIGLAHNYELSFEIAVILGSEGPKFWLRELKYGSNRYNLSSMLLFKNLTDIRHHISLMYPEIRISDIKGRSIFNKKTLCTLKEDIKSVSESVKDISNEEGSNKKFLHSCHHLSEANKKVCAYMLKFMNLCKECSYETFYNVMRDKFDVSYDDRNEIAHRLLQDKVITAISPDRNGDYRYKYTPERVV